MPFFNHQLSIMKRRTLFITLTFLVLVGFGQEKKDLAISLSAGYLNSPYYNKAHSRGFYCFGFDYHISRKHLLSANYFAGGHDYFDNTLSNTSASGYMVNPKGTNARASYNTFSVSYKYTIINQTKLSVVPGVGAGIMTHSRNYAYTQGNSMLFRTSSWSDLVFP
jgi:hypothetical protein